MTPTFKLGPGDAPAIEILPSEINPLVALLVEERAPLDGEILNSILSFLQLDSLYLSKNSESFFLGFESICGRVVAGDLIQYSVARVETSEFAGYLKGGAGEGIVTSAIRAAAQRFLDFLAKHPDHWPLREFGPGVGGSGRDA